MKDREPQMGKGENMTPIDEASGESSPRRRASTIVAYEVVGFLAIIALSWINELLGVPSLIFGSDHLGGWHESLLKRPSSWPWRSRWWH